MTDRYFDLCTCTKNEVKSEITYSQLQLPTTITKTLVYIHVTLFTPRYIPS